MSLNLNNSTVIQHTVTNPLAVPIFVNDAAVTVTIFDSSGVELTGVVWPQTLDFVAASDGIYRKTFAPFDDLVLNQIYSIVISVLGTDSLESNCTVTCKATNQICD
jgi:hypothetical protein